MKGLVMSTERFSPMYQHPPTNLWVRNKGQAWVVDSMRKEYGPLLKLELEGVKCLDVGGHVGSFTYFSLNHLKVASIVSIEPDPANVEVYKKNWSRNKKVRLIEGAAVSSDDKEITLYLGKTYSATNSIQAIRGRDSVTVKAIPFRKTLSEVKPTLLKCDIEGGEYLLDWEKLPSYVKVLSIEYHYTRDSWLDDQIKLDKLFRKQGFKAIKAPANQLTFNGASVGIYVR